MAARATSDTTEGSSIGHLVTSIKDDLTGLVRDEIELAKAELKQDAQSAALGGGLVMVSALLGLLALILASIALAYGVSALGLAPGWAFLVVAGFYLVLAAVLVLVAKGRFGRISGPKRARTTARDAAAALSAARRQS